MAAAMADMPPPVGGLYADKGYKLIITTVVSFVLATTGIVGRLAARFIMAKRLEANDYLIMAGYFMKLGLTILSSLLVHYGMGQHIQHVMMVAPQHITSFLQSVWTGSFIYAPIITFIKLSILSLYYVAFPSRFMKISVYILAAITTAWGIALCLTGLLACIPIDKSWNPTEPGGHCIDQIEYYWGLQIPNIVTDFIICFLPFREIYMLHLPRNQLFQIAGVLSLGLVTCAIDIVRLIVFLDLPASMDITWVDLAPSMWLDLEASIALLCACLPVMRPLLHPKTFYRQNHQSGSNRTQNTIYTDGGEGAYEEVSSEGKGTFELSDNSNSRVGTSHGNLRASDGSDHDTLGNAAGHYKNYSA